MLSAAAFPPELAAALNALDQVLPDASRRAASALELIASRGCLACDGPGKSKLTGDGFPLEFVFSSRDSAIRYTCEAAGPEMAPSKRLRCACDLLEVLEGTCRFSLAGLQASSANLAWGAWLGGRHTATTDHYKVYVEMPQQQTPLARALLSKALGRYQALLESEVYALRIVAFETTSERIELYFRGRSLEPQELRGLLRFSGLSDQEEALFFLLEEATGQPARVRIPGTQHGFSISLTPAGDLDTFTFFAFARSLFGADPNTRSALLGLSRRRGWAFDHYSAASTNLRRGPGQGPCHGIASFVVERNRLPSISVGLRPLTQP